MYAYIYAIAYMCVCVSAYWHVHNIHAWHDLKHWHVCMCFWQLIYYRSFFSLFLSLFSFFTIVLCYCCCCWSILSIHLCYILCFCVARAWAPGQRLFLRRPFSWAGHISTFMGSVTSTNAFAALVCFYCCSFHIILVTISFHRTIKQ